MGKKSRLTRTAKIIILVGVITLVVGGIFSIPSLVGGDQADIGIVTDQYSLEQNFLPFRIVGEPRTTITPSGETIVTTADFSDAIETIQASEALKIIKELPANCAVKLFTTITFDDGTTQTISSGATSFAPVSTLELIGEQGQPINKIGTVPLLTCPVILSLNDERIGYVHQWLQGVNMNWEFTKLDGSSVSINTASQGAGGTSSAPKCSPVVFDDIGDLASTGLYSTSQIQDYKDTFGFQQGSIFIGSERALCAEDVNGVVAEPFEITADEIESRLGDIVGKEFETTITIRMLGGTIVLEIPFISDALNQPFIARTGLDQFLSRQVLAITVDNLDDTPPEDVTPPPSGITRTIVVESFDPVKIDVADLKASDRTVKLRIKLNSYDTTEGVPKMIVKQKIGGITTFTSPVTASINMRDAGVSGVSRVFEGSWVVSTGQSLGTYEVKVTIDGRGSIVKSVEVVQKAEDAPSETPVGGKCPSGNQLVEGSDGTEICVAICADNLKWDIPQQACAVVASCPQDQSFETNDKGEKVCVKDPITPIGGDRCEGGLTFNQNTQKCEAPKTPTKECAQGETLVNTGGGTTSCIQAIPDFVKLLTPIACVDKIGITDQGLCLPPTIVGLFQNPIQIVYIGIAFIIFLVVVKYLINAVNRQRGGIILSQ